MHIPGFMAEASLYRSSAHYIASCGFGSLSSSQVSPHSCGGFKQLFCNGLILACRAALRFGHQFPSSLAATQFA
jgi:hypothetical protein